MAGRRYKCSNKKHLRIYDTNSLTNKIAEAAQVDETNRSSQKIQNENNDKKEQNNNSETKDTVTKIPKKHRLLTTIILLIFIIAMLYTGMKIIDWLKENKHNNDLMKTLSDAISIDQNRKDIEKYSIDFEMLRQTNPDVVGWIKLSGTNIEYPVVQTTNNSFYMTHSFDKTYNSAGWVFVDYKNKLDGKDQNIVIYAHNRKNGDMFGTLKNVLTPEWLDNQDNFIIPFITEKEKAEYEVFSVYKIEEEEYYITTSFATDTEYQKFIDTIKARSVRNFGVEVSTSDQILTLSSCASDNRFRIVVHAKKCTNDIIDN